VKGSTAGGLAVYTNTVQRTTVTTGNVWSDGLRNQVRDTLITPKHTDEGLRNQYAFAMGCQDSVPTDLRADHCTAAYLLWASPLAVSAGCLVFSGVSRSLARSLDAHGPAQFFGLRVLVTLILVAVMGLWVGASLAGAGGGLANAVFSMAVFGIAVLCGTIGGAVGWHHLEEAVEQVPMVRKLLVYMHHDFAKALMVWFIGIPFYPFFLALSAANQFARKHVTPKCINFELPPPPPTVGPDGKADSERFPWVTAKASSQLAAISRWHWTSVLTYTYYVTMALIVLQVFMAKGVVTVMAAVNLGLRPLPFGAITVIFYCIGLGMFLLPPVPGVPVYMAGGVILVSAGYKNGDGVFSFWEAIFVTILVCFFIKVPPPVLLVLLL
jgi:hypothetical protein